MSAKVLYIARDSPLPPGSGGPVRVESIWRTLQNLLGDDAVTLAVLGDTPKPGVRRQLHEMGIKFFPPKRQTRAGKLLRYASATLTGRCLVATRYLSARRIARVVRFVKKLSPDLVILGDVEHAELIEPLKRGTGAKVVCDTHNVWSLLHERVAKNADSFGQRVQHTLLKRNMLGIERRLLKHADAIWTTSDTDAAHYRNVLKLPDVTTVPNVIDVDKFTPNPAGESGAIVFTGFMSYWPNEDAAMRLVEISKRLTGESIAHHLYLVGKGPTPKLESAAKGMSNVTVTGFVRDTRAYQNKASVFVAPLMSGSGTKIKILEALAGAKCVLTTPIGAEGMDVGDAAVVVGEPERFYQELKSLLNDPVRCERVGRAGRAWVERFGSRQALRGVLEKAIGIPSPAELGVVR